MKVMTLLLLCMSAPAFAYKFTVYTDQADKKKATEVINTLKNTYPFNQYEIDFDIKLVEASELNCAPLPGIERAMTCQSGNIARDAAANNIDQAMIVKDHPEYGGTGGSIPVMTSSSPASMAVHEYMHSLGLCDEYKYAASETEFYCKPEDAGQNMVFIDPNPAGYGSELDARAQHMGSIPWRSGIKMETPITHGSFQLGTGAISANVLAPKNNSNEPTALGAPIGLYEGKTCAEATPPKKTWQPGGEVTIMDQLAAGLGAGNEYLVAKALESRGVQKKITVSEEFSLYVNNTKREAEAINYLPHPISNTKSSSVAK